MHKLIATSAASRPTGSPPQRKLFRVPSGIFKGRLAALYMDSATGISLVHSDYPHQSWSSPQQIISDSLDSPFSACMDDSGDIHIVYSDSSKDIKFVKLTFAAGAWSTGSAVTVLNVDDNYNPCILKDGDGKLWCFIINHRTSVDSKYYVRTKSSDDDGQTWGTGGGDLGMQLSSGSNDICYVSACQISSRLYSVYTEERSNLKYRVYDLKLESWESEVAIHTGDYIDDDFDIAVSSDKKLGVAFSISSDGRIYFKEFDGNSWSGLQEIEDVQSRSPQISYLNDIPNIFYAGLLGSNYYRLRHALMSGESFLTADCIPSIGIFDKVFVYDDSASSKFEDKTTAAADSSSGDVYHPESSAMLDSIGDCLYVGKQDGFYSVTLILSVVGAGGQVIWEYFDGAQWIAFTPDSGAYHFDSADKLVYLWTGGESIPSDWQIGTVNNYNAYWIRARVSVGFSSNPVGTQVMAAPKCDDLALVRTGSGG